MIELSRYETTALVSNESLQQRLIKFIDCPLITDLLPSVVKYMMLAESGFQQQ